MALLLVSLSHFFPHPLHMYLLTGGSFSKLLTFSPFLQCLRSFGPLALYSLTPPSTSPSSLPPLDWSRQLSYLPGKDQKTQLRAMGPSPRKHLGMETRQVGGNGGWSTRRIGRLEGKGPPTGNLSLVSPSRMGFSKGAGEERELVCDSVVVCFPPHSQRRLRGRQRKMSQEPGRKHSELTLTASHMVRDWESPGQGCRESLPSRSSGAFFCLPSRSHVCGFGLLSARHGACVWDPRACRQLEAESH